MALYTAKLSIGVYMLWITHDSSFVTHSVKKANTMTYYENPDFCIIEFHIPEALFCSNINAVLQILFKLQG